MVGVAQGLERRVVAPEVGGSNPLTHPIRVSFAGLIENDGFPLPKGAGARSSIG